MQRGYVARTIVRGKDTGMQRRRLIGVERASELGRLSFFFRSGNFSALDTFAEFLLERSQDLVAAFRILLVLLIIVQPKGCVHADKNQDQLRDPTPQPRK